MSVYHKLLLPALCPSSEVSMCLQLSLCDSSAMKRAGSGGNSSQSSGEDFLLDMWEWDDWMGSDSEFYLLHYTTKSCTSKLA